MLVTAPQQLNGGRQAMNAGADHHNAAAAVAVAVAAHVATMLRMISCSICKCHVCAQLMAVQR